MKRIFLFSFSVLFFLGLTSSSSTESYSLFHIGRSKDANIIKYDIQLSNGKLNLENPIKAYWVKHTEGGKVEGLTYTQRTLAYGIKYLSKKADEVKFQFVSYSKRNLYLKKMNDDTYKVILFIDDKWVELKRIHIQIDGGTFLVPIIRYVKIHWNNLYKDESGVEIIKPQTK